MMLYPAAVVAVVDVVVVEDCDSVKHFLGVSCCCMASCPQRPGQQALFVGS
jgi:hypothetical protein